MQAGPSDPGPFSIEPMLGFLRQLRQRCQAVAGHQPRRREALTPLLTSLDFAMAFLERLDLARVGADPLPVQIAVIGPTQAGKSSVLNWLVGAPLARVSPLAGYTVHAQGFALSAETPWLAMLDRYFGGYRRVDPEHLNPSHLDEFGLAMATPGANSAVMAGKLVWDTPDFDSVQSREYQAAVLRVAALADVVLLVVSKDKYGDLSVWEFLRLLEPLEQPTLVLLNKTDPADRVTLVHSVEEKWRAFRADPPPSVVALPYLPDPPGLAGQEELHAALMAALSGALGRVQRHARHLRAIRLLRAHWPAWTAPVHAEHRLAVEWRDRLAMVQADCMERYQRDYLNHPRHYETFQRALAELLTLLEIPGVGGVLLAARGWVTWPVRQITRLGRMSGGHKASAEGGEAALLRQLAEHALARLGEGLLLDSGTDPLEQGWWHGMGGQLSRQREVMLATFGEAARDYTRAFQPEIESTARGLYQHLQEHPVVLNSLRATRVTTDAVALALALHTGGIGVQDFVIAPAMLSVTSLLAESALGRYISRAAEQLKLRQREAVERLLRSALFERLEALPDGLERDACLGIPPGMLARAERALG